jgi:hypothetical protein
MLRQRQVKDLSQQRLDRTQEKIRGWAHLGKNCAPLIVIEVCQMNDTRSTKAHVAAPDQIEEGTIKVLE